MKKIFVLLFISSITSLCHAEGKCCDNKSFFHSIKKTCSGAWETVTSPFRCNCNNCPEKEEHKTGCCHKAKAKTETAK